MFAPVTHALHRLESTFDRVKLGYKWKTGRWHDLTVEPYVGYGRLGSPAAGPVPDAFRLRGRVLDDKRSRAGEDLTPRESVALTVRRFETDEVPGARVRVEHGEVALEVETGENGFFEVEFAPHPAPDPSEPWHYVRLTLLAPRSRWADGPVTATARVQVPTPEAAFAVVSDVDDTVLQAGATEKLRFARTVLLGSAASRDIFPGVGALYRALVSGPDGRARNPIFYLSSSPNNLRRQVAGAIDRRGLPVGPLFLKEFGFDPGKFVKSPHAAHKLGRIEALLAFYPDLPFVLIGDSGQQDPEVYQEAVRRHPGRIRAVLVRDVSDPARDRSVRLIARDVEARGVPMRPVQTSAAAAEASVAFGLVHASAIDEVRAAGEDEGPDMAPASEDA